MTPEASGDAAEPMVGFGGKQAWLAVRGDEPQLVGALLGLHDLGPVTWRTGIDLAYFTDDRVMLTPPLPGAGDTAWVLAVGRWFARPDSTVDVQGLSAALDTEVQYFATDRSLQRHRWQRARGGTLLRSFDHLGREGELLDWRGEPDAAEREAGLPPTIDDQTDILVEEADVLRVAAAWSIDPTTLDGHPAPGPLRAAAAD
jgi:hypothetical protein